MCSGGSFDIVIQGEDSNEFSQDLTEAAVLNQSNYFPLQPLCFESGVNTGEFIATVTLSEFQYNPNIIYILLFYQDNYRAYGSIYF